MKTPQDAFVRVAPIGETGSAADHGFECATGSAWRGSFAASPAPRTNIPQNLNTANTQEGHRV